MPCHISQIIVYVYTILRRLITDELGEFGLKKLSDGNSITIAASTDINKDFKVTVTSDKTDSKQVTYDSTTGETKVETVAGGGGEGGGGGGE